MKRKQIDVQFDCENRLDQVEREQMVQAAHLVINLGNAQTLDEVAAELRVQLPGWFVYQGGSHVALHRADRKPRLAMFWVRGI